MLDLPVTAIAQLFGDPATVGGVACAVGDNTLTTKNGDQAVPAGGASAPAGLDLCDAFARAWHTGGGQPAGRVHEAGAAAGRGRSGPAHRVGAARGDRAGGAG